MPEQIILQLIHSELPQEPLHRAVTPLAWRALLRDGLAVLREDQLREDHQQFHAQS